MQEKGIPGHRLAMMQPGSSRAPRACLGPAALALTASSGAEILLCVALAVQAAMLHNTDDFTTDGRKRWARRRGGPAPPGGRSA